MDEKDQMIAVLRQMLYNRDFELASAHTQLIGAQQQLQTLRDEVEALRPPPEEEKPAEETPVD